MSCVGRKLVLGQRTEEEVETVLTQLGPAITAAGFYSYGEICPSGAQHGCDLHNQTMTLTVFTEAPP
ncbi:MAG: FIST C-terminal domain-containing protein [Verrucomicrobia bacterium]|nr:FIST C-terminal domain-containing protein [Verrucomicrobiota bacterium]